jgi:uncharacterized protein YjeT (DUF2065 family)
MKDFLCVLGLVFIIEGLPYFAFPDKLKTYLVKMAELSDRTLRILGFVLLVAGLGLLYLGRS